MAKFFVSYSRSAKDEVKKVIDLLRSSGHEVWWDGDIPIMADWWATILKNIEWCDTFIFVTSEKSVQSAYCIAELKYANDRQRPILPFILDDPSQYTLPYELPSRGQWLVYNGNPAQMLAQINYAVSEIDWALHRDTNVPRPPEPMTGGQSLTKQFQKAIRLGNQGKFDDARQLLRNVKSLDYGEWGDLCDNWIEQLNRYSVIADLADDESTLQKANSYWQAYLRIYGREFDPQNIDTKLSGTKKSSNIPFVPILIGVVIFVVLIAMAGLALSNSTLETTPTAINQQLSQLSTDDPEPSSILSEAEARETGAAEAYATLTALAPTNTPTITLTPTDTPISSSDIQQTAQAEIFATATYAVQTQAVIAQNTQNAVLTEQFIAGSTATYIAQLSLTPPATITEIIPTAIPQPTIDFVNPDVTTASIEFDLEKSQPWLIIADGIQTGIIYFTVTNLPEGASPQATIVEAEANIEILNTSLIGEGEWAITYRAGTITETATVQVQVKMADGSVIDVDGRFSVASQVEALVVEMKLQAEGANPLLMTAGEPVNIDLSLTNADGNPPQGSYIVELSFSEIDGGDSTIIGTVPMTSVMNTHSFQYQSPPTDTELTGNIIAKVRARDTLVTEGKLALIFKPPAPRIESISLYAINDDELLKRVELIKHGLIREVTNDVAIQPQTPLTTLSIEVNISPKVPDQMLTISLEPLFPIAGVESPVLLINSALSVSESQSQNLPTNPQGILSINLNSQLGGGLVRLTIADANYPDGASISWVFPVAEKIARLSTDGIVDSLADWQINNAIEISEDVYFGYAADLLGGGGRTALQHYYYILSSIATTVSGTPKIPVISDFAVVSGTTKLNTDSPISLSISYTQEQDVVITSTEIVRDKIDPDPSLPQSAILSATTLPQLYYHGTSPFAIFWLSNYEAVIVPNTYIYPDPIQLNDLGGSLSVPAYRGYVTGYMLPAALNISAQ